MDIERELEILIDKHKGKQVGLGEIRLDWFAEDCLKEIRRLKSAIAQPTDEAVRDAIGYIESVKGYLNDVAEHKDPQTYASLDLAITALQAYQPWVPKK